MGHSCRRPHLDFSWEGELLTGHRAPRLQPRQVRSTWRMDRELSSVASGLNPHKSIVSSQVGALSLAPQWITEGMWCSNTRPFGHDRRVPNEPTSHSTHALSTYQVLCLIEVNPKRKVPALRELGSIREKQWAPGGALWAQCPRAPAESHSHEV